MKKLLYLLLFISGIASAQSPVNGSYGRFRDYVSSYTANSNLTTYGRGSGFIDVQDTLRLSGLSGSTFPYINVNKLVTGVSASTFMTNLGGTTIGQAVFTSTNPSAERFGIANADNTFTWATASDFRAAIGVVPVTFGTANQFPYVNAGGTDFDYFTPGTGVRTALGVNVGSAGAFVVNGGALGTPSSGTVTNLTGTASININGTVGATTPNTGVFTQVDVDNININGNTITASSGSIEVSVGGANNATLLTTGAGEAGLQSQGTSSSSRVSAYNNVILDYDTDNSSAGTLLLRRNGVTLYTLDNGGDWDKWGFASAGFIQDANGNELIRFPSAVASAVNEVTISNAATGVNPSISGTGNAGMTLIGGTTTTSTLTYKTTTGVGTTGADHIFVGGNDGADEFMRILNSGIVYIGSNDARLGEKMSISNSANFGGVALSTYSSTNTSPLIDFNRSRNATIGLHTAVQSGDDLGYVVGRGSNGTSFATAANIRFRATQTFTGSTNSGEIEIYTTPNGSTTESLAATFTDTQGLDVVGALSKGSGTFKIPHPLDSTKWLYHSFIEGPQADNIYRGKATLSSGQAVIQIDTACDMTIGTFEALNTDVQIFLQNNETWDLVKATYSNGFITITSNNVSSTAEIDWMVIGERKDETVKKWNLTDENGHLIPEWDK